VTGDIDSSYFVGRVSLFRTLDNALELMELNPHLADLSEYLLKVDIEGGK
jgi:hypothetical protein